MKSTTIFGLVIITLLINVTITTRVIAQDQHLHYKIINLGTVGGTSSGGNGINNRGWVTGAANLWSSASGIARKAQPAVALPHSVELRSIR